MAIFFQTKCPYFPYPVSTLLVSPKVITFSLFCESLDGHNLMTLKKHFRSDSGMLAQLMVCNSKVPHAKTICIYLKRPLLCGFYGHVISSIISKYFVGNFAFYFILRDAKSSEILAVRGHWHLILL